MAVDYFTPLVRGLLDKAQSTHNTAYYFALTNQKSLESIERLSKHMLQMLAMAWNEIIITNFIQVTPKQ